ncbi:MAG TPA: ATP-dependent metallopeptidase FtsH/Yme1/Tma family protein, partial [Solirubrobacteraceae bacterium]
MAEPPSEPLRQDPARQDASRGDVKDRGESGNGRGGLPGWRITPAPDGRGPGGAGKDTPNPRNTRWIVALVVVGVLALNFWISSQALKAPSRVQIPYSPTFLQQVENGNVSQISSTGDSIEGSLRSGVRYPPDSSANPKTLFSTQVPSFANNAQLSQLLQDHGVTINAHPANAGPSFLAELLFGFGPTLLLVLLFVFLMRRAAAAGGAGGLMSFGRSRARRVEGQEEPITFADVAGIDEAKEELTEIVDFLKTPDKYLALGA